MTIAGVVLAAGAGSRFEGPEHKLLAELRGKPVVVWVLEAAIEAGFNQLYVVTGAIDLQTELMGTEEGEGADSWLQPVTWLNSADWESGQSQSLQVAVHQAEADGHDAVVIGLGDQPMVPASAWRSVGASRGAITVAEFEGERRPPVKLEKQVWSLLPNTGDFGARELMRSNPELVGAVPCSGKAADIDTQRDLKRWS